MFTLLLNGCASRIEPSSELDMHDQYRMRDQESTIIVQVCLPAAKLSSAISMTTVRKGSFGGGGVVKSGTTSDGQIYYEKFAASPNETKALLIFRPEDGTEFAFIPPTRISTSEWSQWSMPVFASKEFGLAFKLLNSQPLTTLPTSLLDSPRMRFILMSFADYLERTKQRGFGRLVEAVPGC
jgi:hypothetical protein